MNVRLAALDVVVQVVAKGADQVDGVVAVRLRRVPGKEHKGNVADVVADAGVSLGELARRLAVGEEDLGKKRF